MSKRPLEDLGENTGRKGISYAISAYVLWGVLPLYWKALEQVPAGEILANRILWSFLFVAMLLLFNGSWRDLRDVFLSRRNLVAVFLGACLISANWLTYIWAVNNEKIVEASLGYYINPLFTIFLGLVVLKERIDKWQVLALFLALVGVIVMTVQYGQLPWVSLVLALTFGLYGLVKKRSTLNAITGLALETLVVMPLALGYVIYLNATDAGSFGTVSVEITLLLVLAGVVTATPLLLFAQGAKRVSLSTLGFIQYLSPSISLLLGVFLYKEPFTWVEFVSFGFIWLGLGIYSFSRKEVLVYFQKKWFGPQIR